MMDSPDYRLDAPRDVGLSLTEQLLPPDEQVPMDSSDCRLDALVTGHGVSTQLEVDGR